MAKSPAWLEGWRVGVAAGLFSIASISAASSEGQSNGEAWREADGIVVGLRSDRDGVTVDWRFRQPPPAPVRRVEVTMNGQPLGPPAARLALFPARGQTAVLKVLIDSDDVAAADMRETLSRLSSLNPRGLELNVQDLRARSSSASIGASGAEEAPDGGAQTSRLDLASALEQSIEEVGSRAADRRAILVVPGARVGAPFSGDVIAAHAKALSVAIFVITRKEKSSPDFSAFLTLSRATNGSSIGGDDDLVDALSQTFLSGAEVHFPFGDASRYLWQSTSIVTASLFYGDRQVLVTLEAAPPAAGWRRSAAEVWRRTSFQLSAFVAGALLMLAAVVAFRFFSRPRIF